MLLEMAPLVSALLLWAAFPPLDLGLLVFVAPAPFLAALRRARTRRSAFLIGLLFGLGFFAALLWWIKFLGFVAIVALALALAAFTALYGLGMWYARTWPAGQWWIAAVGGWALMEFVRSRGPVGGFEWGQLGYGLARYAWPRGAAQFIGTTGWTVVVVGVAAGLALAGSSRERPLSFFAGAAGLAAALTFLGWVAAPGSDGNPVTVAVIQGNSPCPAEHCPDENRQIFDSHLELTRSLGAGSVDLVVWPESSASSSFEPVTHPEQGEAIAAEARRLGAYVLVGANRSLSPEHFLNVNVVFDPTGAIIGEYAKQHPVPFGEYIPLRPLLDWIPDLDQVPRDMVRGDGPVTFDTPDGAFGSVISFEGAFSRRVRPTANAGAELLIVATNEASYRNSPAADQFIAMTRMRAAEFGLDTVHAAITGKSAIIRADGTVVDTTELFTADTLVGEVRYRTRGPTLYARLGDWMQFLAIMSLLTVIAFRSRRPQEPPRRDPVDFPDPYEPASLG